jgi:glycine cleavage system transcriptional repressor
MVLHMHAILTAIGSDRPGLVDEVSQFIFDAGGNIEDSRMVNLRGQFAMMVLFSATDDRIEQLRGKLGTLNEQTHLTTALHAGGSGMSLSASSKSLPYRLTATAIDQSGLVHRISHALRESGVNIESLESHLAAAPYTGAPMFEMELLLTLPPSTPIKALRTQLGQLCDELNIDWQLEAI